MFSIDPKKLVADGSNTRASEQEDFSGIELFTTEKGGQGKSISVIRPDDMLFHNQLKRLGYELVDGYRRIEVKLKVDRSAPVICDGKHYTLKISEVGIVTVEEDEACSLGNITHGSMIPAALMRRI